MKSYLISNILIKYTTISLSVMILIWAIMFGQTDIASSQTDSAYTWHRSLGPFDATLTCVAQHPSTGDIYVCATRGILVSRDSGQTWERAGTFTTGEHPMAFGDTRSTIAFDSQGRIFAASGDDTGEQVIMSDDHGHTWRRISLPSLYASDSGAPSIIGDVLVDEQDRVYYCIDNRIYRSLDAIHNLDPDWNRDGDRNVLDDQPFIRWEEITPPGDPGSDNVFDSGDVLGGVGEVVTACRQITIHNASLYLALDNGLYRSDNYATAPLDEITWHKISSGALSHNDTIAALDTYGVKSFTFDQDGALYAGHYFKGTSQGQGLFMTSNPTAEIPEWTYQSHPGGQVLPFFTSDGKLITGLYNYGGDHIHYYNDFTGKWDRVNHHRNGSIREFTELTNGSLMAVASGRGVLLSHDDGMTWQKSNQGIIAHHNISGVSADGRIYEGGLQTPMYSDDEGYSWQPCGLFELDGAPYALATSAMLVAADDTVYVATEVSNRHTIRTWKSTDKCTTWTEIGQDEDGKSTIPNYVWFRALAMTSTGQLFGGVWDDENDGGIYAYDAETDRWIHLPHNGLEDSGIDDNGTNLMRVSQLRADTHGNLLASVGYEPENIFISADNGASWIAINEGIPTGFHSVRAFDIAPNGDLLINTASSGIFKAVWNGDSYTTWESLGLALYDSQSITADTAGNIYSGNTQQSRQRPEDHGIYMLPVGSIEWIQIDANELHQGGSVWAHPNPSTSETLLLVGADGGLMRSCGLSLCSTPPPTPTPTAASTDTPIPVVTSTPVLVPTSTVTSDEPNDACLQATTISVNGIWQDHNFHTAGDIDWVRIDTVANTEYHIEIVSPFDSRADVEPELYSECNSLPEERVWSGSFGPGARLTFKASQNGPIYLRLTNLDDSIYGKDVNYRISVRTPSEQPQSRALIIVAGRLKRDDPLQANIHSVTERVYQIFEAEGYTKDDIYYLATDQKFDSYDAPADLEHIELAITQWARDRLGDSGVLTIYIMDHGNENRLYIDGPRNQILTPDLLDEWLTTLESAKRDLKVNVILEACHIGSFITGDSNISAEGRVIITSSDVDWLAYASKSGAYFSDYFLTALQQGRNLFDSYYEAENYVSGLYTFQKPWLDANGNGIPNEREDDRIASQRSFAYAGTLDDSWSPYIARVIGPDQIDKGNGILQAEVRDDGRVEDVWGVIYPPSYVPEETRPGELIQETLQTLQLISAGNDQYRAEYASFDEIGTYRIVIHAEDNKGLLARPRTLNVVVGYRLYLPKISR